jgi:hypothetical protein
MIFDTASKDIICISYPSGGFGNFLYYILSEFASQTVKLSDNKLTFSKDGNSHSIVMYTNTYFMDPDEFQLHCDIDPMNNKVVVLCDNGINNDSYDKINVTFPNARIVRIVIDPAVRPIIYQTCIIKAVGQDFNTNHSQHVKNNWSDAAEDYAIRENFTLLYHNWSYGWEPSELAINLSFEQLLIQPIDTIKELINQLDMQLVNEARLKLVIDDWYIANAKYFNVYSYTNLILTALENKENIDISHIVDLHEQGYINYCIEKQYNIEIPVYDYRNWFQSTEQIQQAIIEINEKDLISN